MWILQIHWMRDGLITLERGLALETNNIPFWNHNATMQITIIIIPILPLWPPFVLAPWTCNAQIYPWENDKVYALLGW
jgi:hypothetical protein